MLKQNERDMKSLTLENRQGQEFQAIITDCGATFKSYGHWNVYFTVRFEGNEKDFKVLTTDSQFIDEVNDVESYDEANEMYFDKFFNQDMEERVLEWIEDLVEA